MSTRIVLGSRLLLAACGGDNATGTPPPVKPVAPLLFTASGRMTLSVAPAIAAAEPGVVVGFAARDQVNIAQKVIWCVNGLTGGTSQLGTVSASGQYSAPATISNGDSAVVSTALSEDMTRPPATRFLLVPPARSTRCASADLVARIPDSASPSLISRRNDACFI